jgi:hypothetical protein
LHGKLGTSVPVSWESSLVTVLDNLVGVHDDGDEEGEHHVDEKAHKGVEVHPAVHPNCKRFLKIKKNNILQLTRSEPIFN